VFVVTDVTKHTRCPYPRARSGDIDIVGSRQAVCLNVLTVTTLPLRAKLPIDIISGKPNTACSHSQDWCGKGLARGMALPRPLRVESRSCDDGACCLRRSLAYVVRVAVRISGMPWRGRRSSCSSRTGMGVRVVRYNVC